MLVVQVATSFLLPVLVQQLVVALSSSLVAVAQLVQAVHSKLFLLTVPRAVAMLLFDQAMRRGVALVLSR